MSTINNSLDHLLSSLTAHPESPVVFELKGQAIFPGYHITEIKHAQITSVDCGRGTDQWNEWVIQLLDGSAQLQEPYMSAGKLQQIVGTATKSLTNQEDESDQLFFEFAHNNGPLQKLSVSTVAHKEGQYRVYLSNLSAECKPATRYFDASASSQSGGSSDNTSACC